MEDEKINISIKTSYLVFPFTKSQEASTTISLNKDVIKYKVGRLLRRLWTVYVEFEGAIDCVYLF